MSDNQLGLCRICLAAKPSQVTIFNKELHLSLKIMELADIEIEEEDGLPPNICTDCESDVEKCYEFRTQVRWANEKLRGGSVSQIDVEECNIKQEHITFESIMDEENNTNNEADNDEVVAHESSCDENSKDNDECGYSQQVSHVEMQSNKEEGVGMINDPLGQEEPLIEATMKTEAGPADDPLKFMKVETEPMDIDNKNILSSPSPSSTVMRTVPATSVTFWQNMSYEPSNKYEKKNSNQELPHHFLAYQELPPNTVSSINPNAEYSWSSVPIRIAPEYNLNSVLKTNSLVPLSFEAIQTNQTTLEKSNTDSIKTNINALNVGLLKSKMDAKIITNISSITKESSNQSILENLLHKDELMSNKKIEHVNEDTLCSVCNIKFFSTDCLNEHINSETFTCRVCTLDFNNHDDLKRHFTSHSSYKCNTCNAVFYCRRDLIEHKNTTPRCNIKVDCELCERKFLSKKALRSHNLKFHSGIGEDFQCMICNKGFKLVRQFFTHLKLSHVAYENLECRFCKMIFLGPEKLKSHIKTTHLVDKEDKSFVCPTCGKIFHRKNLLQNHQRFHDKSVNLCHLCGKSILGKQGMKQHRSREHGETGEYMCTPCNKTYPTQQKLSEHLKKSAKHTSAQPVYCEICGKPYKNAKVLREHLRIHSDEKPFKCEICGAAFKILVTLRTHSRVHSNISKYCCSHCGVSFKWKQTFSNHQKKCSSTD